jgi:5-hydroxyisourate hydrolase
MNRISTHVLDVSLGRPAKDVLVRLERRELGGEWSRLSAARTDGDGRCSELLPEGETLKTGLYRIAFDTTGYYLTANME